MSTEPNLIPSPTAAPIENEIPTYRAVSASAVVALILGILSVLSFASFGFVVFSALAIVVGFLADRKIQRYSDVLTGRSLAQAGIGLGLIFGLTAFTVSSVQGVLRASQAKVFANTFQDVLLKKDFNLALWYAQKPHQRELMTPEQVYKELSKGDGPGESYFIEHFAGLRAVLRALDEPGARLHFNRIESHGEQELMPYAGVVYDLEIPDAKLPAEKERRVLAVIKGTRMKSGRLEWWVEDLIFPYNDYTFVGPTEPIKDDGHGHAH